LQVNGRVCSLGVSLHSNANIHFLIISHGSTEKVPALCGISRIWVHASHRGEGIASQLLDTACRHFIYGHPLDPSSIAFSQPTGDGKNLAIHYTRNSAFLIYPEEAVTTDQVHLD
jgi:GNAT superfamily N-acetyltransferase